MLRSIVSTVCILLFLSGCKEDTETFPSGSLAHYVQQTGLTPINDLIACAATDQNLAQASLSDSVSIFFLPTSGALEFRYFETDHAELDPHNHTLYQEVALDHLPVFGGFLRRFTRKVTTAKKWCIVTFQRGDSLFYSNPILLKSPDLNTEFNSNLLAIDQTETLRPQFNWQDGMVDENVIYFQVISDAEDNLISGTYTIEQSFQFYDLSNVVLNINDVTPPPTLVENETYYFTLMAVSIDNWVNLIISVPFDTGN